MPTARAREVLERIGLARRGDVPAGQLSYAEQRALEIGVTIAAVDGRGAAASTSPAPA